ncbi:DUF3310 domain-containing protein [Bacillus sp. MCCB 382]|uniref:DUF3310 domain-containing protein n=1 Tax=Bacillus sp. MCCB 382 TaxID=2860197 RepID=UPI001C5679A8|nr:DUF3310 domain-containing protein [Bacillus sp. MCCB 382]
MQNINFDMLPDKFNFKNIDGNVMRAEFQLNKNGYKVVEVDGTGNLGFAPLWEVENNLKNGTWQVVNASDLVNKPSHYHKNEIDVNGYLEKHFPLEGSYTVAEGFYIGNVIKYTSRYKDKGGKQDLEKAKFNLNKLIELEESQ